MFLNNSGAAQSPEAMEGPKTGPTKLGFRPRSRDTPTWRSLQCIPGESIVKAKHFLWSRARPTTITFHIFICSSSRVQPALTQISHTEQTYLYTDKLRIERQGKANTFPTFPLFSFTEMIVFGFHKVMLFLCIIFSRCK